MQGQQRILDRLDELEHYLFRDIYRYRSQFYLPHPCHASYTPQRNCRCEFTSPQVQQDQNSYDHQATFTSHKKSPGIVPIPLSHPLPAPPSETDTSPSCLPLPAPFCDTGTLPSEEIPKDKLTTPQTVLLKYRKLRGDALAGNLSVKLAKEAYFGEEVMRKCTLKGNRGLPGLPHKELSQLKQTLFSVFPKYWSNPAEFEPVWAKSSTAIGQACKAIRFKTTKCIL